MSTHKIRGRHTDFLLLYQNIHYVLMIIILCKHIHSNIVQLHPHKISINEYYFPSSFTLFQLNMNEKTYFNIENYKWSVYFKYMFFFFEHHYICIGTNTEINFNLILKSNVSTSVTQVPWYLKKKNISQRVPFDLFIFRFLCIKKIKKIQTVKFQNFVFSGFRPFYFTRLHIILYNRIAAGIIQLQLINTSTTFSITVI